MISVIICTRNTNALSTVTANVAATVGVPHEIIAIDNSRGQYGICEAYNIGASRAQYELLCFMHEDVHHHTKQWGRIVTDILADLGIGVLGVAGGTYQVDAPAGWGGGGWPRVRMQVMHTLKSQESVIDHHYVTDSPLVDVATLDGLWLCCRKTVWQEFQFDHVTFPGFHFYDVDFCTRVFTKYRNCVTFDILIEHFSHGSFDKVWYANALHYYQQRRHLLPFGVEDMSASEASQLSLSVLHQFTSTYIDHHISLKGAMFLVRECLKRAPFNRNSLWLVKKLLKTRQRQAHRLVSH